MPTPKHQPTNSQRGYVKVAAADAVPHSEIAARIGISEKTLRLRYRAELTDALGDLKTRVHANFLRIATGDSKAAAWAAERWLRMRAPEQWRDQPLEVGNAGGQPFAITIVTGVPRATDTEPPPDKTD